jgi:DNA-binding transcriptional MerR regulator
MSQGCYRINELAELAGISVRTLHHYDRIGLVRPRRETNGYRVYQAADVARLQQVLLFRACGLALSDIGRIIDDPAFDEGVALREQLARLQAQRADIDRIIATVEKTLAACEKGAQMSDKDRFEGLKAKAVAENEKRYGAEARRRFGDEAVDAANDALLAMDEKTWNDMDALEERIKELLRQAMAAGDTTGAAARELVSAHARWLQLHWGAGAYTPEAHRGLADGYLADERFVAYYDGACGKGATQFLRDAICALA